MKQVTILSILAACFLWPATIHAWQDTPDWERVRAAGLQVEAGKYLTLITDTRDRTDVAEFTQVFDRAVPQWCEYFSIDPESVGDWRGYACVMEDRQRFADAGLIPQDLPPFPAGLQRGNTVWLYAQPGEYYTRHLLLHEGTHAFMQQFLGDYGPPWYAEGIAELLAVHRWQNGQLELNHEIIDRAEVPWWGRVKLVRTDRDVGQRLSLNEVLEIPVVSFRQVNAYGWVWAACVFFDRHPETHDAFRQMQGAVKLDPGQFNRQFREALLKRVENWSELERAWQIMVDEIEYGYDVAAAVPVDVPQQSGEDPSDKIIRLNVARGWQRTGIRINAGQRWSFASDGMYQVRDDGQSWSCNAAGVTIDYYRDRPLGQLVAAIVPAESQVGEFPDWIGIGKSGTQSFSTSGVLWLRINESPAEWHDNQGELSVTIRPVAD